MMINQMFDSSKVCKYMPAVVSVICVFIYFADITEVYSVFLMLIVGFGASLILTSQKDKNGKTPIIESIESAIDGADLEESVFVDVDYSETMLLNLEKVTLLVNDLSEKQIESSRVQTEDAVTAIINRVMHLSEDLQQFSKSHELENDENMRQLNTCLSDILVSFQFQDRTSQILNHVSCSLEIFNSEIKSIQELREKGGEPEYDCDDIVKKITAGFTTAEQRAMVPNEKNKKSSDPEDNIELF